MVKEFLAIVVGCLALSSPVIGAERPEPQVSLLSCALVAAERTSVPAMLAESNLSSKSSQLSTLAGLLAAAGRFDRALEWVESAEEPDRVIAPALAAIAVGAIRLDKPDVAQGVSARLSAMKAWTVPAARSEIVEALHEAGRTADAEAMLESMGDPAAKAGALIDMARSTAVGSKQGVAWLQQAFQAAREIWPSRSHHVMIAGRRESRRDYGERLSTLLEVAKAFAERGQVEAAHEVAAVIGNVPEDGAIWKARTLAAIGEVPAAADQALELLGEALKALEVAIERTVGDTRDKVEILGEIARLFERLGKKKQALQALEVASMSAETLKNVDEPSVRMSIGVETLALLAHAYSDLGSKERALTILDQAQALVDAFVVPKRDPSARYRWIKARATIAAAREQAGRGGALGDAELIAEVAKISKRNRRDSAWLAVARAYLDINRPGRALAMMRVGKAKASDQLRAWKAVGEDLLAADRLDDAVQVAFEMPDSFVKVELLVDLADRFSRTERGREAEQMIAEVFRLGRRPTVTSRGRDRLLVTFAGLALDRQSSLLMRPVTSELRKALVGPFRCHSG